MQRIALMLTIFCLLNGNPAIAQIILSGTVTDSSSVLPSATVSILNAKDTSWIKSEITDDKGDFELKNIQPGNYIITATASGYLNRSQLVSIDSASQNMVIVLH